MNFVRALKMFAAIVIAANLSGCDSRFHPSTKDKSPPRESTAATILGTKNVYRGLLQTAEGQILSSVELTLDVDKIAVMNVANFTGHLRTFTGEMKNAAISFEFGGLLALGSTMSFDVAMSSPTYSGGYASVSIQVTIDGDKLVGTISGNTETAKLTASKDAPLPKSPEEQEIQTQFTGTLPAGALKLPPQAPLSTPAQVTLNLGLLRGATDIVELANFVDRQLDMDVYLISHGDTVRLNSAKMNKRNGSLQVKAKKMISDTESIAVSLKCTGTEDGGKDCTWTAGQTTPLAFHVAPLR
jgi:hypothetical protein